MEAAAFSTGVSIQYPHGRPTAGRSVAHRGSSVEYPFPFPADSRAASKRQDKSDTEAYSVCQEIAYHFAYEKTRRAVQELLRKNNDTSYSQVLRFFEKYCAADGSSSVPVSQSPSGRLRDPNAPVLLPQFHAFPTAAVIAGTDATSSDLWVEPLTHKLRRTFPLCVPVQRDVSTARRFVEWLAARMAKLCEAKKREETWLEGLVDNFDLLPLDRPPVGAGSVDRRVTRLQQARGNANAVTGILQDGADKGEQSDAILSSESSSDDSESDEEVARRGKRKRRLASVAYGRWTMSKLLATIQRDIDELVSPSSGDIARELVTMLDELVLARIQEALAVVKDVQEKEDGVIIQTIACYHEAVMWLERTISTCRTTAAKLLNVAPESGPNSPTTAHIGCTEMALARMLQRVLYQYAGFLEDCTLDREVVRERRKAVRQRIFNHESDYTLKRYDPQAEWQAPAPSPRSFLLLYIEQLEAFSQQVLGEFLEIWTNFMRQQQESRETKEEGCTLGLVIGVASATSPALRRLDLTVTNRLELQFFSLVDSRKCFDDVLEALVVKARLPLALSGDVLRAIASRHHRLPSVPRLLLALRFLLFTHFRRCPWSFLALAVDGLSAPGVSPPILVAANETSLPHRVSPWVRHQRKRATREAQGKPVESDSSLASWLAPCSALELGDLQSRVLPSTTSVDGKASWITVLGEALLHERHRHARWRMGWQCFRSACTWLDVRIEGSMEGGHYIGKQEQMTVIHLALALEGRLGEAPRFMEVLRRLQNCTRWAALSVMIEDWRSSFRASGLNEDDLETTLGELAMLCAYARTEKPPAKMLGALREELVTVFTTRLITALLHPPTPGTRSTADALVESWSVLRDANVLEERLRLEYHDNLRNVLQDAGIGEDVDTSNNKDVEASWVHDVGLAFLFYQESASASLSLREWYESFSAELQEESNFASKSKSKKRKAGDTSEDAAIKARFVRAVCTLRHWGFIKHDAPRDAEQDIIEKLVFI
ncbi:hypothetical protein PF011_g8010 [Phytophthora fragariae]|uniref:Uncharacterized protein n=1 Tax=Phytophthora fragariae TaxID=53985 RepID=A0A6A3L703_9STRA|nr:hypothetical protein PF011_g8010 [Phytophthora fragariae]